MSTETVVRTVVCELETSRRKNERIQRVIDEWQAVAGYFQTMMPSMREKIGKSTQDTQFNRMMVREWPKGERETLANTLQEAFKKVDSAYNSMESNGEYDVADNFGSGSYARFPSKSIDIVENDRGFGLSVKLFPYRDPEWFHIRAGSYQQEYLQRIVDGEMTFGTCEIHRHGDGLSAHLSVKEEVEVLAPEHVETVIGVDLGLNVLFAAAAVDVESGEVRGTDVESGRAYLHHRTRIDRRRKSLMSAGGLRYVRANNDLQNYTKQIVHEVANRVIAFAVEYDAPCILLEDLTGLRANAERNGNNLRSFVYSDVKEKILYKATHAGIPATADVPAHHTSTTHWKCGTRNPDARRGLQYACETCDETTHADVNAAINIARAFEPKVL